MTYGELRQQLSMLSIEQLSQTATVQVDGEVYPIEYGFLTDESQDVLDPDHFVLVCKSDG